MAAPMIAKSKTSNILNKVLVKEKSSKLTQKPVLCVENLSWPRPTKLVEEAILTQLSSTFKSLPKLFDSKKASELDPDGKEKKRIRAQLQIGSSSVFRALERKELECVLVSGNATPAISVEHIIASGRNQGCPLLCLDGLSPAFAAATESKCLPLTLGFKRQQDNQQNDFVELVSLIKEHAPVTRPNNMQIKWTNEESQPDLQLKTFEKCQPSHENKSLKSLRVDVAGQNEIMTEVKRVFSSHLIKKLQQPKDDKQKKKKKQKAKKKNVKEPFDRELHVQFEAGKRAVLGAVERERLDVILVSQEVEEVLAGISHLSVSRLPPSRCPPVIVLPCLTSVLREMTYGACCLSFLGLKKLDLLPAGSKQDFEKVIELCQRVSKNILASPSEHDRKLKPPNAETDSVPSKIDLGAENEKNVAKDDVDADEEEEEQEDYSYLYILKKDSKDLAELRSELQQDLEKSKKDISFSTDFISLSGSSVQTSNSSDNKAAATRRMTSKISINKKSAESVFKSKSQTSEGPVSISSDMKTRGNELTKQAIGSGFITLSSSQEETSQREKREKNDDSEGEGKIMDTDDDEQRKAGNLTAMSLEKIEGDVKKDSENSEDNSLTAETTGPLLFVMDKKGISPATKPKASTDVLEGQSKSQTSIAAGVLGADVVEMDGSTDIFSLDRGGSALKKQKGSSSMNIADKKERETTLFSQGSGSALGSEALQPVKGREGMDYLALDVSARSKQKTKALKRKLDKEEGFISFAYTPANIKTMVADPSKKRKKKKK